MIPNDEVFALRLTLNVMLVMRRPRRPSDPGWVPPIALSSCSGEWIKRVSLTGLTSSLLLHQSEGVRGQINWLPMAHCLQPSLIIY